MIELKEYAGLIRNYKELAEELGVSIERLDRKQREEQLMVAAYEKWGKKMGKHINGQFALALYDTDAKKLFCTRDKLGAELLFYYVTKDGKVLVATQIKDLFDQPGYVKELNPDMIQFYLGFTYVPGETTLFKDVHKLAPGGYLFYDEKDGLVLGRYWKLKFEPDDSKTLEEWADEINDAMDASLRDIADPDETPDSFLSGGVDSSYILAKSNAKNGICASYADQKVSEAENALKTAQYLHRGFQAIMITPEEFFGNVDEFLLAYEQPSADVAGLSLYCACKQIANTSTLVYSGEGADEFFAGYNGYGRADKYSGMFPSTYYGATYIMSEKEQRRYLQSFAKLSQKDHVKSIAAKAKGYDPLGIMLYTDMLTYFEGSILFNSTKITRGTGLDIRMPYCDLRIFDIARRMPSKYKATEKGNKIALRAAAAKVLPHDVAYRKKLGFPVPVQSWLKEEKVSAGIRRAFESKTAAKFFDVDEIGALLDAFLGEKPRVSHPIWFGRRKGSDLLWRHVWTIFLFIRWYELFFEEN